MKRRHFGYVGGPDSDIISGLNRTVPVFTGMDRERQTKLSQARSLTLQDLNTDGRFESDARTLLRKQDFLFGDSINEDADVMLDGSYKWLHRVGEHRFFLSDMEMLFSLLSIQLMSLHRPMEWDLTEKQSKVPIRQISHHT